MSVRPRLSYANVVATLALTLVVTGGGVAVAGGALKKNSVGSAQIRNGQVKHPDLAKNAVTGGNIANGTVLGADVKDGSLDGRDVRDESLTGADVFDASLVGADVLDGSLTGDDVLDGSLTGDDVLDDSLTGDDVDESTLDIDASTLDTAIFAASSGSGNTTFTGGQDLAATLPFTAPTVGWVMITAQASLRAESGNSFLHARILQDNQTFAETDWDTGDVDSLYDQHQSFTALLPVTAGAHTFKLTLQETQAAVAGKFYDGQLLLQFSPRGSSSEFSPRGVQRGAVGNAG